MNWNARGASDIGRSRKRNEDAFVIDDGLELAIVADGMGGHACGDEASRMAATLFRDAVHSERALVEAYAAAPAGADPAPVRQLLRNAMERCSHAVFAEALRDPGKKGMGTTCSALLIAGRTTFVAHVGDSRVYLVRDRKIAQLTRDHNLLDHLVLKGEISREEAASPLLAKYRNALSRAVGVDAHVDVDTIAIDALPGDTYLLCSDGLTRYICEDELAELVRHVPPERLEKVLIDIANQRGGVDNITVVCVRTDSDHAPTTARVGRLHELIALLAESPLFGDLDHGEVLHALTIATVEDLADNSALPEAGLTELPLFCVLTGGGELIDADGSRQRIGPGEWFGALSLTGLADRPGPFIASEPTRVVRFDAADLIEILGESPVVGRQLLESYPGA